MWDDGAVWAGAEQGVLPLRTCRNCRAICHPPLPVCPQCRSMAWDQVPASGRARLKSWFVSIRPDQAGDTPRIVAVVELAEGIRFVSNLLEAEIDELYEDMALELCFDKPEDMTLPLFRPAAV